MASGQESGGIDRRRAVLLAVFVVVGIGAAIHLSSGDSEESTMPQEFVDEDVVAVSPLVPAGRLSGASWRTAEQIRDEKEAAALHEETHGGSSVFEGVEWAEDEDRKAYDKSVEETVREIEGLGVYVAPAEKPADAPKKK